MDQLGALYVSAATDIHNSCLHDPPRVANLVDQLQSIVDKSTVPRKNFLVDTTTNRGDAVVAESSAMKNGIGWVTLQVTEGIHRGVHEWCIRIEDQGETTDGSGLMVGLVPKNFNKYDSFISQGGGWCLSRAGKFYGHWRRQDSESESLTFGTGDRVIFLLDYDAAKLVVKVGNKQASGHVSNLSQEVFPAVSLHYRHQHVRFEYHLVHERNEQEQNWIDRMSLPCAPSFMPLSGEQMGRVGLDSYLFSPIFAENLAQLHLQRIRRSSLIRLGLERDSFAGPEGGGLNAGAVQHRYASREGIAARLTVLRNAFVALHKQSKLGPLAAPFLSPDVTPEYLRHTTFSAAQATRGRLAMGGRASSGGAGSSGFDAAMECGGVLLIHLFVAFAQAPNALADPLILSLLDYLLSQPLLALREPTGADNEEAPTITNVTPATLQLAADNIASVIERELAGPASASASASASPQGSSPGRVSLLVSLLLVLSAQRGKVSELLRACRLLLRAPESMAVTDKTAAWLTQHAARRSRSSARDGRCLSPNLWPHPVLFDVQRALQTTVAHAATLAVPTRLEPSAAILSVGYSGEMVYVHTREHLSKWGQHQAPHLVLLESTKEPADVCVGASQSSMAVTTHAVFLTTNRMRAHGLAVVEYNLSLQVRRSVSLDAAGPLWSPTPLPILIATAPHDTVVLLRRKPHVEVVVAGRKKTAAAASDAATASAKTALEIALFASNSFPLQPLRTVVLTAPEPESTASLSHCVALDKNGLVDLGPPLILQGSSGHVTIELLAQLPERTATATTVYRHGDKSSCGEVFIETTVLDGARCVRGGYRHDTRGSCVVSAPLSPLADAQFLHITLVFDGKWSMYFDGVLVAANNQGPHVSLDTPKLNWCIGEECTCALAGFRAWRVGRSATEVARDYARLMSGTEPGLVRQLLFSEEDGNVVFNFSEVNMSGEATHLPPEAMAPRHAICVGGFRRLRCPPSQHLWASSSTSTHHTAPSPPRCSPLHDWASADHMFVVPSGHIALASFVAEDADTPSPYAHTKGTALVFFDAQSGEAKPCAMVAPLKTMPRAVAASDPAGRMWTMVETAADAKTRSEPSGVDGANPRSDSNPGSKSTVLAVALVAFSERGEVPTDAATANELPRPVSANLKEAMYNESVDKDEFARDGDVIMTCKAAAHCMLHLLAAHAALPTGLSRATLYSPFRDDVCQETVHEVVSLLGEYVRLVKGSNARRMVSLKDEQGPLVALAALRVLRRLLHQSKAYRLHPSVIDLNASREEDEAVILQELMPLGYGEDKKDTNRPDPLSSSTVRRLLSLLASILNEGSAVLPQAVLGAAADALREGVDIMFASVDARASVLQRALESESTAANRDSVLPPPSAAAVGSGSASMSAMDVVKQALERSFASMTTATALLAITPPSNGAVLPPPATRRPSLSLNELLEVQQGKLERVQGLLNAILAASLREMRLCTAPVPRASQEAVDTHDGLAPEHKAELGALSAILSTLQMLLLGTCVRPRQTRHRDGAADVSKDEEGIAYASVTSPFAIHTETEVRHHGALKAYYTALFAAAREGIHCLLRERRSSTTAMDASTEPAKGSTGSPVLLFTSRASSPSQSLTLLHPSRSSRAQLTDPNHADAAAEGRARGTGGRRRSVPDPHLTVAELSFLATPLHTALNALPYALTPSNAEWFSGELQALVPLTEAMQQACQGPSHGWDRVPFSAALAAVHDATIFALSWTSVFLATVAAEASAHDLTEDHTPTKTEATAKEVQWLLSCPFVASGVGREGGDAAGGGLQKTTEVVSADRRNTVQALFLSHKAQCAELQRAVDVLGRTTPDPLVNVLTRAAVTVLYASNASNLARAPASWLEGQLQYIIKKLIPLRNTLLARFRESSKATSSAVNTALVDELESRCQFLLDAAHPSEADVLTDPLFRLVGIDAGAGRTDTTMSLPAKARWRRAGAIVRRRLALRRLVTGGSETLSVPQALSAVTHLLLSDELTATRLAESHAQAVRIASLRGAGLKALRQLLIRMPSSVECVSLLMLASSNTPAHAHSCASTALSTQYSGIHDDACVRLAPAALRSELAATLRAVIHRIHSAELSTAQDERQLAVCVDTATAVEVHGCPTSVLCDALQFAWGPRDLPYLRLSGAVADVFARHGSLFMPTTTARGSAESTSTVPSRVMLREESQTEQRHRDKAAQFVAARLEAVRVARGGVRRSALAMEEDEELTEGSTLVTTGELNMRRVFQCLQRLGLHCCGALTQQMQMPLADQLCCVHFLTGIMQVLGEELRKCAECASGTAGGGRGPSTLPFLPAVVERVEAQVRLVCSVLSTYAGALPPLPIVGSHAIMRAFSTACAKVAHWLLVSAHRMTTSAVVTAACQRTAMALLSRCHPDECDTVFATASTDALPVPAEAHLWKLAAGAPLSGATLLFLIGYATQLLQTRGMDEASAHAVEGLRVMLSSPQWVRHLQNPSVVTVLEGIVKTYAPSLASLAGAEDTTATAAHINDKNDSHGSKADKLRHALAMLVSVCALGGCLLHVPLKGLPCELYVAGTAAAGVPANAFPLSGFVVDVFDPSESDDAASKKSKDKKSKETTAVKRASVAVCSGASAISELSVSQDVVFMPTNSAAATEATPSCACVCPAWACDEKSAAVLVERFILPLAHAFEDRITADQHCDDASASPSRSSTSTDVACLAAFLDLVRQLSARASLCHTLVTSRVVRVVNRLAAIMAVRSSLPAVALKEFAAMAWCGALREHIRDGASSGELAFGASPAGKPFPASSPSSSTQGSPSPLRSGGATPAAMPSQPQPGGVVDRLGALSTPVHQRITAPGVGGGGGGGDVRTSPRAGASDANSSYLTDLMRVRAQVMSLMGHDALAMPIPTSSSLATAAFTPTGFVTRGPLASLTPATAAAGGGGASRSRIYDGSESHLLADSLCTLCLCAHPQRRVRGTVTVSDAARPGGATLGSLCAAGCTVEVALLLCHRVFVDLGESCSTQETWAPPPIKLDVLSLSGGSGTASLRVYFADKALHCAIVTDDTTDGSHPLSECSLAVTDADYDRFLHVAVFVDASGITLAKGGATTTLTLSPGSPAARHVQTLLEDKGGIQQLVIGNETSSGGETSVTSDVDAEPFPLDGMAVLVSGLRVSSGVSLRASVKAFADIVSRDRTLPMLEPSDEPCAFIFHEGRGVVVNSTSGQYCGRLEGLVGWTPLCYGVPPLAKDRRETLYTGYSTAPGRGTTSNDAAATNADGHGGPVVPRQMFDEYMATLSREHLEQCAWDQMWSLCAHFSRGAVVTALSTCTRASYAVECGTPLDHSDVFLVLGKKQVLARLFDLLVYHNAVELPQAHVELIQAVVSHALGTAVLSRDERHAFLDDLSNTLPTLLADVRDSITVPLLLSPPAASSASTATAAHAKEVPVVVPLAVFRPGPSVTLSFEAGKPRSVEQVLVCRDTSLATVAATYPDTKGGWGAASLPHDVAYVYLRLVRSADASSGAALKADESGVLPVTLSLKSLRPVMARAAFSAVCASAGEASQNTEVEWPVFRSELIAVLSAQCLSGSPLADESVHVAAVLSELMQTWASLPHVGVRERAPLHILLAPLNELLVMLLQSRREGTELEAMRSPSLGTYNVYLQELFGVLAAAMGLEASWRGVTVERMIQHRWQCTIELWRRSTEETSSTGLVEMQQVPRQSGDSGGTSATTVVGAPVSSATKLPSGEWDVAVEQHQTGLMCRCSTGCTTGTFYYELNVPPELTRCREFALGVASGDFYAEPGTAIEDVLGADAQSWLFSGTRLCRLHNGIRNDFPARLRWKPGDVIGILVDIAQRRIVCTQNGRHVSAFDRIDTTTTATARQFALFPFICIIAADSSAPRGEPGRAPGAPVVQCRLNFGAAAFLYPPVCDYLAVDPTHYSSPTRCRLWLFALGAQWARKSRTARAAGGDGSLLSVARSCLDVIKARVLPSCAGRSGPMWVRTLATRRGPAGEASATLDDTHDSLVCWEDGAHGFVRGTVSVTRGKWYYEVALLRGAGTALAVGWSTTVYHNDGSTELGEDDHSWVLEGKRMVAKHDGAQRNVDHAAWADGDVLGCALDCDAGTIAFSLNGEPLRAMRLLASPAAAQSADKDTAVFSSVCGVGAGMTPALFLRGKTVVQMRWGRTDLQYTPPDHQPLEAGGVLCSGLTEYILFTNHAETATVASASTRAATASLETAILEKKIAHVCATADISPNALTAYCLDLGPASAQTDPAQPSSDAVCDDAAALVKVLSGVAEVLLPFAHCGALPVDVDACDATWACGAHPTRYVLALCRSFCLPYVGLHLLRSFTKATNGAGDNVRLTLNRRGALAITRDTTVTMDERVQRSLVGQVHSLLQSREPAMFMTNKKLWSVLFSGEGAEDVGGPYRECLSQMTSELMSTALPFFVPSDNQVGELGEHRDLVVPNSASTRVCDRMMYLFIGRLMGGCLRGSEPLSLFLPSVVWKALLGDAPTNQDLTQMDLATVQALSYVEERLKAGLASEHADARTALDEALSAACPGGFTVTDDRGQLHYLVERGDAVPVTSVNASLYVKLVREWKLTRQFAPQLDALKEGFLQVVPRCAIGFLKWYELEKAVCGQRDYDPDTLLDAAVYDGLAADDQRVLFLRQVLRDFTAHERALFMRFVSGRDRLPHGVQLRIQADSEDGDTNNDASSNGGAGARRQSPSGSAAAGAPSTSATAPRRPSQPRISPSPRRAPDTQTTRYVSTPPPPSMQQEQRLPHASTCFFILTLPRYSTQEILHDKLLFAIEQCIDMDADFRVRDGLGTDPMDGPVLAQVESDEDLFEDFTHLR